MAEDAAAADAAPAGDEVEADVVATETADA
jgi:hypothetical protein